MEEKTIFKNKIIIDLRVLNECQKKIDKTRFYKLMKMLNFSISADGLHPESTEEHDKYFEPRTEAEKDLWESCRKLAKKDMEELIKKHEGGKKGAEIRKQKSTQASPEPQKEKNVQELLAQTAENLSVDKAKDKIWIDDSFSVEKYPVFKIYVDEMPGSVIKSVEKWLKEKKKGEKVSLEFITQQFINFAKRQNKPLFRKEKSC